MFPQYSSLEFVICGQLIDLAVLHVDVNKFSYSAVAAAAIAHSFNKELAIRVSGELRNFLFLIIFLFYRAVNNGPRATSRLEEWVGYESKC